MDIKIIFTQIWNLLLEMAPYLLFGFLIAGILSEIISKPFIKKHLGSKASYPELKAALFGIPMPICSCGVLPLATGLRRQGASASATTSFITSTPQTGIDSLLITYALLGWVFALFRAAVAFISGIICGLSIKLVNTPSYDIDLEKPLIEKKSKRNKILSAFKYGFITIPKDISKPLLIGIILAAILTLFLPETIFSKYLNDPLKSMFLMIIIGLPLYVCSSASVPLAYAFIESGVPFGSALIFLIMGPATNIATFTTMFKLIGVKGSILFIFTLSITALISGLIMNYISPEIGTVRYICNDCVNSNIYSNISGIILIIILLNGIRLKNCK